jgi:hypothetical protein
MKVAVIKQLLDTFGPWRSVRWEETSPQALFDIWPGRPLHWEMTTLLQADWYIVPQQCNTDYTYDSVLKRSGNGEILRRHTQGIVEPSEIPFESYDLVITNDPILRFPRNSGTLYAYFVAEHWDRRYRAALDRPRKNADLFFAHMLDAPSALHSLPQAVAFPYLRDPKTMRVLFASSERDEAVWADWRTLSFLSASSHGNNPAATKSAAERLQEALGLPVAFRRFSPGLYYGEDPPRWGDGAEFLRELGRQKYYLCLGRNSGAGQGLADAASLDCICFGERDKAYHRLLCHPETLCADLQDLPRRVNRVRMSRDLQKEICSWQNEKLQQHFIDAPLALLADALERKRRLTATTRATAAISPNPQPSRKARAKAFSRMA